MSKSKNMPLNLLNIELIGSELNFPPDFKPVTSYDYGLDVESKFDQSNKLVIVKLIVEIRASGFKCASQTAQFWFDVSRYEKEIKRNRGGAFEIPDDLQHRMNAVAISTSRGMIYFTLKGTILHNAILPNIDPSQL